MRDCLSADEVLGFLDKTLDGVVRSEIDVHLAECADCVALVAATLRSMRRTTSLASGGAKAGVFIGPYEVEGLIGTGGQGAVYRGLDRRLGRTVALKVQKLNFESGSSEMAEQMQKRLLAEARHMARLVHPNVVSIFDVGSQEEQVYFAMELVEGENLRQWLNEHRASWTEIVEIFLKAGRGLAAAHAVGVVHRDFKPENVLIGTNGEVKVMDFGLALGAAEALSPPSTSPAEAPYDDRAGAVADRLTRPGFVSGTPGYMSPEHASGQPTDARGDQFSFCVALHESLYRKLPYPQQVRENSPATVVDAPERTDVPAWVRRIMLRGLSVLPEDRFASMDELLAALRKNPALARRRFLAVSLTVALALVSGLLAGHLLRRRSQDICYQPEAKLSGIWDPETREEARKAALATGDGASSAWAYAEKEFDKAAGNWVNWYREACEATRERSVQPESALLLRLDCLDRQRLALKTALDVLKGTKGLTPGSVAGLASGLPLSTECADASVLSVIEPPPLESQQQLSALRVRLAEGRALRSAGQATEALEVLQPLAREAQTLGYRPFVAEVVGDLAYAQRDTDQALEALESARQSVELAEASHLDRLAAMESAEMLVILSDLFRPASEIDQWIRRGRALVLRTGPEARAEQVYEWSVAWAEHMLGRDGSSVEHDRRALALARELFGDESPLTVAVLSDLAGCLESIGDYEETLVSYRKVIDVDDAIYGRDSAKTKVFWSNLSLTLATMGRLDEAHQASVHAVAGLAPNTENNLTTVTAAVEARICAGEGKVAEALRLADKASEAATRLHLSQEDDIRRFAAEAYILADKPLAAIREYERLVAFVKLDPQSSAWVVFLRLGGAAYLAAGQPKTALPLLERALTLSAAHPFYPGWVPEIQFHLAQALVATHGDRERAMALARSARDELAKLSDQGQLLAKLDAWRAEQGATGRHRH